MIQHNKKEFSKPEEVLKHLEDSAYPTQKVAIIGGHYLIDYDADDKVFVPLIHQDIDQQKTVHKVAKLEAGDFPYRTFKDSVQLHKGLKKKSVSSQIILFVNDHKTPYLMANKKRELLPELRKAYFDKNTIPNSYSKILSGNGILESDILLRSTYHKNTVNRSDYLFSETFFRKKFDKTLKKELLKVEKFQSVVGKSGKREVVIEDAQGEICSLNEGGKCWCSGEVTYFIYDMVKRYDFKEFIFFVPAECSFGVKQGIYAIMTYYLAKNIGLNIKVATNLPYEPDSAAKITLNEYQSSV
jgi:hypothetical protein